jgi:hypothetical protein
MGWGCEWLMKKQIPSGKTARKARATTTAMVTAAAKAKCGGSSLHSE